jgi:glycerol-3-phosphate cytidylyltransferase
MIRGFIAGAFDIIHPGYIAMFEEAKDNCDILYVGLHIDPSLERPQKLKPVLGYFDRFRILTSIKYVDFIYAYTTESSLVDLLKLLKPDVRFLGDDYAGKPITGEELNIPLHYLDRSHEWSTTKFKQLVYNQMNSI